jgi:3-deoxy-D-arabino-heptulosonate 7-phosphate (DAHP) synthase class II
MTKNWTADSWKKLAIKQQPNYKNSKHLQEVER